MPCKQTKFNSKMKSMIWNQSFQIMHKMSQRSIFDRMSFDLISIVLTLFKHQVWAQLLIYDRSDLQMNEFEWTSFRKISLRNKKNKHMPNWLRSNFKTKEIKNLNFKSKRHETSIFHYWRNFILQASQKFINDFGSKQIWK